ERLERVRVEREQHRGEQLDALGRSRERTLDQRDDLLAGGSRGGWSRWLAYPCRRGLRCSRGWGRRGAGLRAELHLQRDSDRQIAGIGGKLSTIPLNDTSVAEARAERDALRERDIDAGAEREIRAHQDACQRAPDVEHQIGAEPARRQDD